MHGSVAQNRRFCARRHEQSSVGANNTKAQKQARQAGAGGITPKGASRKTHVLLQRSQSSRKGRQMNKLPQATSFLRRNALYLSWAICLAGAALAAFTLEAGATAGISQSWPDRWLAIGPVPLPLSTSIVSIAAVTLNLFWSVREKGEFENGLVRMIASLASIVALALALITAIVL